MIKPFLERRWAVELEKERERMGVYKKPHKEIQTDI
jgi:hypothetical protein